MNILEQMLKENVGVSILDSGGTPKYVNGCYVGSSHGYGRSFERNQCRNFEMEQPTSLSFRWGEISVVHNLYHWLKERVDLSEDLDRIFYEMYEPDTDEHDSYIRIMEAFPDWLRERGVECSGLYGDGDPFTVNMYNHESLLSQAIQYLYMELDGEIEVPWSDEPIYLSGEYYLLQIHGGADARGGYTKPRAFEPNGNYSELALLMDSDGYISCENGHNWSSDDGYHWYEDGSTGGTNLETHKIIEDPDEEVYLDLRVRTKIGTQFNLDGEPVPVVSEVSSVETTVPAKYAIEYRNALEGIVNAYSKFGVQAKADLWDESEDELPREFIVAGDYGGGSCPICGGELEAY